MAGQTTSLKTLAVLVLIAGAIAAAEPAPGEPVRYEYSQQAMGVRFRMVLYASDKQAANSAAAAAFARVRSLDRTLSDYDSASELMRLCASAEPGRPMPAGEDLRRVLTRSLAVSRESGGAFDVTVGPLTRLWRRARRRKRLPSTRRLRQAREAVGWRHVQVDERSGTVTLARKGMRLDLGGIAKGYAVDAALEVLKQQGVPCALVDGSGDIVVGKPPPGRTGWTIGVAALRRPDHPPTRFLCLANAAVATSGDAYQAVEIKGVRYSHLLDPKTGLGLTTRSSVTVVAADATTADALASAVSVLGFDRGMQLVDRTRGVEALLVTLRDGRLHVARSKRWLDRARADGTR